MQSDRLLPTCRCDACPYALSTSTSESDTRTRHVLKEVGIVAVGEGKLDPLGNPRLKEVGLQTIRMALFVGLVVVDALLIDFCQHLK